MEEIERGFPEQAVDSAAGSSVPQYSPNAPHFSGRQVESRHYI
jgi:hypothetical protein